MLSAPGAGVPYVTLLCVFSMGLAAVPRNAALSIGVLIPLFTMVSSVLTPIPGIGRAAQFLPDLAGQQMLVRGPVDDDALLGPDRPAGPSRLDGGVGRRRLLDGGAQGRVRPLHGQERRSSP